jgi:uncharacterized protein
LNDQVPKIEFPCDYPIKVVGDSDELFAETVVELTRRHAPEVTEEQVSVRSSRHGNYCAVTIMIRATGEPQLRALHETLRRYPLVRMVL